MIRNDTSIKDQRIERIQGLMGHVALFLLVNVVTVGIDLVDGARGDTVIGLDWAYWLLIPWTVIFMAHLIRFFSRTSYDLPSEPPSGGADLESDRIRDLVSH